MNNCDDKEKCKTCIWRYDEYEKNVCVCEDEEVFKSNTHFTDQCIGYLDEEFEVKLFQLRNECAYLLNKTSYDELLKVKDYLTLHIKGEIIHEN